MPCLQISPYFSPAGQKYRHGTVSCLDTQRSTESLSDSLHELISYILPAALSIRLSATTWEGNAHTSHKTNRQLTDLPNSASRVQGTADAEVSMQASASSHVNETKLCSHELICETYALWPL